MKILLIKSVFCPNNDFLEVTIKSLIKTNIYFETLKQNYIQFDLLFIGWVSHYSNQLKKVLKFIGGAYNKIFDIMWTVNYGKYKIINESIKFVNNNSYDFVLYMDHDIYFDFNTSENFGKIFDIAKLEINGKKLGLIAFNQKGDIRHQPTIYENNFNDKIIWSNDNSSIASGSFLISADIFKNLDNLAILAVYGLDDYYLCKQLSEKGYLNVVIKNCYIVHPKCDKYKNFNEWKKNNIIKLIKGDDINYFINIEESNNLFI